MASVQQASNTSKKIKMLRLTKDQMDTKLAFIHNYLESDNAASGSVFDPNSNVTNKNVGTLMAELNKDINIQIKRHIAMEFIAKEYGSETASEYEKQLEDHLIYCHDETATVLPYCAAVSISPFIEDGLKAFGGDSKAPKHLSSYNGGLINLTFALSSQFAGAIAIVEYLFYFNYFAIKDYGVDYLDTHESTIKQELQQFIYAINQPAAARGFQSVFFNLSIFDINYYTALFGHLSYPDGSKPRWEDINRLQRYFLHWFNEERTKALLTFPVVTCTLLTKDGKVVDKEYEELLSKEISEGNSFFVYMSDTVDSLSSCCRLQSNVSDQINDFQYSLGAGGVMTGSINVITLNMNRFIQDSHKKYHQGHAPDVSFYDALRSDLVDQIGKMQRFQVGFRRFYESLQKQGMLPAYTAHYIELSKQYCTLGINGILEAAEFLGVYRSRDDLDKYIMWLKGVLEVFTEMNKLAKKNTGIKFNTEFVPAESLGVKFATWDKIDGYIVPRDCYNSYLYPVESDELTLLDKFRLHGKEVMKHCDGGSSLHANLESWPTKEAVKKILNAAAHFGCPYFGINVLMTACNDCGYIDKRTCTRCSKCGSSNIDYVSRIIGYLKRISNYSKARQVEASHRYYHPRTRSMQD